MTEAEIAEGRLTVRVKGLHKLWALTSSVKVPLARVGWAEVDDGTAGPSWKGLRVGTAVPGVIVAGYYYRDGAWSFWDVSDPDRAVVIYLRDGPLAKRPSSEPPGRPGSREIAQNEVPGRSFVGSR